ncbi:MAG: hypothetical protein WCG47_00940, partial [Dermatophilaceae bacterium]
VCMCTPKTLLGVPRRAGATEMTHPCPTVSIIWVHWRKATVSLQVGANLVPEVVAGAEDRSVRGQHHRERVGGPT